MSEARRDNWGGMTMFNRITFDPQILKGRASIRGMRIPVSVIVGQIAHGVSCDEVLEDYPDLEHEDIEQAIAFSSMRKPNGEGEI
jgi:uncharacterized protein (DUF433 family)